MFYWAGTDRIKDFQKRTYKSTMEIYVDMPIHTTAEGKVIDLLEWYLLKNPQRRTADGVEMCVTEEEVAAHPRHLNIFGGLPFDVRFSREADKDRKPFEDPFPAAFEDARGCTNGASCPDVHGCDVLMASNKACGSTTHNRQTHRGPTIALG